MQEARTSVRILPFDSYTCTFTCARYLSSDSAMKNFPLQILVMILNASSRKVDKIGMSHPEKLHRSATGRYEVRKTNQILSVIATTCDLPEKALLPKGLQYV